MFSRRTFLAGLAAGAAAPMINRGRFQLSAATLEEYSTLTLDLVRASTVIDMLGLITLDFRKLFAWQGAPARFQQADFEKIKASGINIFHPATGYTSGDVYRESLADIQGWNRFIAARPEYFTRIDSLNDLRAIKTTGKIGILIGQQNSGHFRTVEDVDYFYKLGQRVSQLTYYHNRLGGGSTDANDTGLSPFGTEVLARMNRLGMAVDVSHCGDKTTLDAIDASSQPVLVTHSNCRFLAPGVARCKTDEAIRKMSAKGGVIGITMIRAFVGEHGRVTMEDVLNHIDHVAQIAGVEHVGIGSDVDLDGRDARYDLDGVRYLKKVFDLTEGLVRRKYTRSDIELILGGNFQRALSSIWGT
jgi:membrane dipeptidase